MVLQTRQIYEVQRIEPGQLSINGLGDHPSWDRAPRLSEFVYPWNEGSPPAMSFQALHDKKWLYGLFRVHDPMKINIYVDQNTKRDVLKSDRVEIFFRQDEKMNPYYGLEMDPLGRIYDYEARFYRKSNSAWTWPVGHLLVKGALVEGGYTLEWAVSKASLKKLKLLKGRNMDAGLYRGQCISIKDGAAEFKWISWVRPDSPTPDFHIPSSYGEFILK